MWAPYVFVCCAVASILGPVHKTNVNWINFNQSWAEDQRNFAYISSVAVWAVCEQQRRIFGQRTTKISDKRIVVLWKWFFYSFGPRAHHHSFNLRAFWRIQNWCLINEIQMFSDFLFLLWDFWVLKEKKKKNEKGQMPPAYDQQSSTHTHTPESEALQGGVIAIACLTVRLTKRTTKGKKKKITEQLWLNVIG